MCSKKVGIKHAEKSTQTHNVPHDNAATNITSNIQNADCSGHESSPNGASMSDNAMDITFSDDTSHALTSTPLTKEGGDIQQEDDKAMKALKEQLFMF